MRGRRPPAPLPAGALRVRNGCPDPPFPPPLSPAVRERQDGAGLPPRLPLVRPRRPGAPEAAAGPGAGGAGRVLSAAVLGGRRCRRGGGRGGAAGGVLAAALPAGRRGAAALERLPERPPPRLRAPGRGSAHQPGGAVVGLGAARAGAGVPRGRPAPRPARRSAGRAGVAAAAPGDAARSPPGLWAEPWRPGPGRSAGGRGGAAREPPAR